MLKKVLILDHSSLWSRFVAKSLLVHGYDSIEVGCPEELALLKKARQREQEHSFIIVDHLNGRTEHNMVEPLEAASTIAALFPGVPFIVASSRPTPDEAVLAYRIGASGYIPKTFDEGELIELLQQATERAKPRGRPETHELGS